MNVDLDNPQKCAKIASDLIDTFAGVCNKIVERERKEDPDFTETLPSLLAGTLQFAVRTFMVAGYNKEQILESVEQCYENSRKDETVLKVILLRSLMESMGDNSVQ